MFPETAKSHFAPGEREEVTVDLLSRSSKNSPQGGVQHRKTAPLAQVRVPCGLKPGAGGRGPELAPLLTPPSPGVPCPPARGAPRGRASPGQPAPPSPTSRPRPLLVRERSPGPAPGAPGRTAAEPRPPEATPRRALATPLPGCGPGARAPARGRPRRAPLARRQKAGAGRTPRYR